MDDRGLRPNQSGIAGRWVEDANEPGRTRRGTGRLGKGRDLDD